MKSLDTRRQSAGNLRKERVLRDYTRSPERVKIESGLREIGVCLEIGRKLLLTDEMPQGELPVYDLDISEFPAVVVGARGVPPLVEAHIQRIQIPTASYSISVAVHYEELQIRRYPLNEGRTTEMSC